MSQSRIRLGHEANEIAENTFSDYAWLRDNEKELLEEYGERIILVFQKQVIGTGQTIDEAVADAENNLPPEVEVVTPILEFLHHRQPFFRVRAKASSST